MRDVMYVIQDLPAHAVTVQRPAGVPPGRAAFTRSCGSTAV